MPLKECAKDFEAQLQPLFHHYEPALKTSEVISVAVLMILLIVNVQDQVLASSDKSWIVAMKQCIQSNHHHICEIVANVTLQVAKIVEDISNNRKYHWWSLKLGMRCYLLWSLYPALQRIPFS